MCVSSVVMFSSHPTGTFSYRFQEQDGIILLLVGGSRQTHYFWPLYLNLTVARASSTSTRAFSTFNQSIKLLLCCCPAHPHPSWQIRLLSELPPAATTIPPCRAVSLPPLSLPWTNGLLHRTSACHLHHARLPLLAFLYGR